MAFAYSFLNLRASHCHSPPQGTVGVARLQADIQPPPGNEPFPQAGQMHSTGVSPEARATSCRVPTDKSPSLPSLGGTSTERKCQLQAGSKEPGAHTQPTTCVPRTHQLTSRVLPCLNHTRAHPPGHALPPRTKGSRPCLACKGQTNDMQTHPFWTKACVSSLGSSMFFGG